MEVDTTEETRVTMTILEDSTVVDEEVLAETKEGVEEGAVTPVEEGEDA